MADREGSTVVRDVAIIVIGSVVLVAALIGFTILLAYATEPSWADITIALWTVVLALATLGLATAAFLALASIGEAKKALDEARNARNAVQMTELSRRWDEEKNQEVRRLVRTYAEAWVAPDADGWVVSSGSTELAEANEITPPERLKEAVMALRNDNHPHYRKLITDPNFLEDIAIMIAYGGIDGDIVRESLGWHFAYRWSLWRPTVIALRDADKVPETYENLERLANDMARHYPTSFMFDARGEILWDGFKD